jgi:hypothetical protein
MPAPRHTSASRPPQSGAAEPPQPPQPPQPVSSDTTTSDTTTSAPADAPRRVDPAGEHADPARLPISIYQHRYFAKWAQAPHGTAFNTSLVLEISGKLNRRALRRAAERAARKHEVAHATYSEDGSEQRYTEFAVDDYFIEQDIPEDGDLERLLRPILSRPFDLRTGPAFQFHLLCRGARKHYLVVRAHHIIADATAARILIKDLIVGYGLALFGLHRLMRRYSYAGCVRALEAAHTAAQREAARAFWKSFLTRAPLRVAFPVKDGAVDGDHTAESIYFDLDRRTSDALIRFARQHHTTLFIVLSALYGFLLSRYANQPEVLISYPCNMRPKGHGHVVGCFVNLALQKTVIGTDTTFASLVDQLTRQRNEVKPHQFYRLSEIINEQGELRADIEKSCFSVFFGATFLSNRPLPVPVLDVRPLDIPWTQEFDRELRLLYDVKDLDHIKLRMDFQSRKFDRRVIEQFIEDYKYLSERAIGSTERLVELELPAASGISRPGRRPRNAAS